MSGYEKLAAQMEASPQALISLRDNGTVLKALRLAARQPSGPSAREVALKCLTIARTYRGVQDAASCIEKQMQLVVDTLGNGSAAAQLSIESIRDTTESNGVAASAADPTPEAKNPAPTDEQGRPLTYWGGMIAKESAAQVEQNAGERVSTSGCNTDEARGGTPSSPVAADLAPEAKKLSASALSECLRGESRRIGNVPQINSADLLVWASAMATAAQMLDEQTHALARAQEEIKRVTELSCGLMAEADRRVESAEAELAKLQAEREELVLVPKEPTQAMLNALEDIDTPPIAEHLSWQDYQRERWKHILAASQPSEQSKKESEK